MTSYERTPYFSELIDLIAVKTTIWKPSASELTDYIAVLRQKLLCVLLSLYFDEFDLMIY